MIYQYYVKMKQNIQILTTVGSQYALADSQESEDVKKGGILNDAQSN